MDDQNNQNTTGMFTSDPYDGDTLKDSGENNPFFREITANSVAGTPSSPVIPPQAADTTNVVNAPVVESQSITQPQEVVQAQNEMSYTQTQEVPIVNSNPFTVESSVVNPVQNDVNITPTEEVEGTSTVANSNPFIVEPSVEVQVPQAQTSAVEPIQSDINQSPLQEIPSVQTQVEVSEVVNQPLEHITPEVQVTAPIIEEPTPVVTPEVQMVTPVVEEPVQAVQTQTVPIGGETQAINPVVENIQTAAPITVESPVIGLTQETPTTAPLDQNNTPYVSSNVVEPISSTSIDIRSDLKNDLDSVHVSTQAEAISSIPAVNPVQPTVTGANDASKSKAKDIALIVIVIVLALLALILGIMLAKNSVPV